MNILTSTSCGWENMAVEARKWSGEARKVLKFYYTVPQKVSVELPYDESNSTLRFIPPKINNYLNKYTHVFINCTIYNNRKVEIAQRFISGWLDKWLWYIQTVKYCLAIKGMKSCDACYNFDEPWRCILHSHTPKVYYVIPLIWNLQDRWIDILRIEDSYLPGAEGRKEWGVIT